jgi:predicted Zn-dependent protease
MNRIRVGVVPLVQAKRLSRALILGLTACVIAVFGLLMVGGDTAAEVAVNLTPYSKDIEITQNDAQFKAWVSAKLPDEHPIAQKVEVIGQRLVAAIPGGTPFQYRFHVLPVGDVNAVAFPGGDVFVFAGIFDVADTNDKLASVLAHEIQHVEQRHGLRGHYRAVSRVTLFGMLLGIFGTDTAVGVAKLGMLKHSRERESEADLLGLKLLFAAGFPREAMVDMLNGLAKHTGISLVWLSDHPDSGARARAVAAATLP